MKPCLICQREKFSVYPYRNWGWPGESLFDELQIVVCESCGFGIADPETKVDELNEFYRESYRRRDSPFFIDFENLPKTLEANPRSAAQLALVSAYSDLEAIGSVLELGPGRGDMFSVLSDLSKTPKLHAVEPARQAASFYERAFGVVNHRDLDEIESEGLLFSLIVMSHVLEHFSGSAIIPILSRLARMCQEGGHLLIEVPFEDYRVVDYAPWNTPHLTFFSLEAVRRALSTSGWDVLFIGRCGPPGANGFDDPWQEQSGGAKGTGSISDFLRALARTLLGKRVVSLLRLLKNRRKSSGFDAHFYSPRGSNLRVLAIRRN